MLLLLLLLLWKYCYYYCCCYYYSTCNLLSSCTVLIWLAIVTIEAFLFNCLHDLISSFFILNYSWRYNVQKPRWTRKVMLKFQLGLSHETNYLFQRSLYHFPASKLSLPFLYLLSSVFCSLRKITGKNLPLESCFGEIKFCWESAEIWLPYHLGSMYTKWLALRANFNLKKFENLSIQFEKQSIISIQLFFSVMGWKQPSNHFQSPEWFIYVEIWLFLLSS